MTELMAEKQESETQTSLLKTQLEEIKVEKQ